jgi:cyclopropane fatty-acyl-phospholipid synthase-like methyltransferase
MTGLAVIDIGCGKGEILARLAERYKISGVGVDNLAVLVRMLKKG